MALLDPPSRLWSVLERDDLLAAALANDFSADRCAVHDGPADRRVVAIGDQQDTPDRDGLAGLSVEQLDFEFGADFHAVLLSAGLDDCVHGSSGCVDDGEQMRGAIGLSDMG